MYVFVCCCVCWGEVSYLKHMYIKISIARLHGKGKFSIKLSTNFLSTVLHATLKINRPNFPHSFAAKLGTAEGRQEQPGAARSSEGPPRAARAARSSQRPPRTARSSQGGPAGVARSRQGPRRAARSHNGTPGASQPASQAYLYLSPERLNSVICD